ncbi:hypothetical protein BDU57DRAFT_544556 [Ampelomyces quisqualis]|uniref:Uncharacterized protein n=1 Tax=Ampelomyces quisqualis TaxID=50730 RepID=A0A6A5QZW5_AMPQU|nr:hypothetical protein BDU57DRAFT_544556 [Ampelomyces quisqualis]
MKFPITTVLFWAVFVLLAAAKSGGDYSCHGHEGETKCVGAIKSYGTRSLKVCYQGLWLVRYCKVTCHWDPVPRCVDE